MVLEGSHSPPLTGLWQCSCEENAEKKKQTSRTKTKTKEKQQKRRDEKRLQELQGKKSPEFSSKKGTFNREKKKPSKSETKKI